MCLEEWSWMTLFIFLFFFYYILLIMLLYLSQFFSQFCPSPPSNPPLPQANPHLCLCLWVMCISSLAALFPTLYFTSPWLFCNYLIVLLNPLTSHPFPRTPLPSGNHQNTLHIHDSVSVRLVCLVCFLDSVVGRYIFIAILLCIVLIFFFFNKFL